MLSLQRNMMENTQETSLSPGPLSELDARALAEADAEPGSSASSTSRHTALLRQSGGTRDHCSRRVLLRTERSPSPSRFFQLQLATDGGGIWAVRQAPCAVLSWRQGWAMGREGGWSEGCGPSPQPGGY